MFSDCDILISSRPRLTAETLSLNTAVAKDLFSGRRSRVILKITPGFTPCPSFDYANQKQRIEQQAESRRDGGNPAFNPNSAGLLASGSLSWDAMEAKDPHNHEARVKSGSDSRRASARSATQQKRCDTPKCVYALPDVREFAAPGRDQFPTLTPGPEASLKARVRNPKPATHRDRPVRRQSLTGCCNRATHEQPLGQTGCLGTLFLAVPVLDEPPRNNQVRLPTIGEAQASTRTQSVDHTSCCHGITRRTPAAARKYFLQIVARHVPLSTPDRAHGLCLEATLTQGGRVNARSVGNKESTLAACSTLLTCRTLKVSMKVTNPSPATIFQSSSKSDPSTASTAEIRSTTPGNIGSGVLGVQVLQSRYWIASRFVNRQRQIPFTVETAGPSHDLTNSSCRAPRIAFTRLSAVP